MCFNVNIRDKQLGPPHKSLGGVHYLKYHAYWCYGKGRAGMQTLHSPLNMSVIRGHHVYLSLSFAVTPSVHVLRSIVGHVLIRECAPISNIHLITCEYIVQYVYGYVNLSQTCVHWKENIVRQLYTTCRFSSTLSKLFRKHAVYIPYCMIMASYMKHT